MSPEASDVRADVLRTQASSFRRSERFEQAGEDSCGLVGLLSQSRGGSGIHVTKTRSEGQLVFDLASGPEGHVEKANVVGWRRSSTAFNDIGCDRDRRSSKLRSQTKLLLFWKGFCRHIYGKRELVGQFECPKLPMISHLNGF